MMAAAEGAKPIFSALEEEAPIVAAYLADFEQHVLTVWLRSVVQVTARGVNEATGEWATTAAIPFLQLLHRRCAPAEVVIRAGNLAHAACGGNPAVVAALTSPILLRVSAAVDHVIDQTVRYMVKGGTAASATDVLSGEIAESTVVTILEIQNILLNFHRATA